MSQEEKPSYVHMAFHNAANYAFLFAGGVVSVLLWRRFGATPIAMAAAAELAWLSLGWRSFRPYFDYVHREHLNQLAAGGDDQVRAGMNEDDRTVYETLEALRDSIRDQISDNPSVTMELIDAELAKVDQLLGTYAQLAKSSARYEQYVETSDLNQIEEAIRKQKQVVESSHTAEARDLAQQNLAVLEKRLEKSIEVRHKIRTARGQLNLIENTFKLLRDQILVLESPQDLRDQLQQVTGAINAIERTEQETAKLSQTLDRELRQLRSNAE